MGTDTAPTTLLEVRRNPHLVGLGLTTAALIGSLAIRGPDHALALFFLPLLFLALGHRVWPREPRPQALRLSSAGLEIVRAGSRQLIPWFAIASVRESGFGLHVRLTSDREIQLPRPARSRHGALRRAIPAGVDLQLLPPSSVGVWVWVCWAWLLGVLALVWLVDVQW